MIDRTLEHLEVFEEELGKPQYRIEVPDTSFDKYRGVLPDALLTFWQKLGWSSFAEGIFWIVNPEDYDDLIALWLQSTPFEEIDHYHIIARSAFGKLYAWGQNNNQYFTISCPMHALVAQEKKLRKQADDPNGALGDFFSGSVVDDFDMKDENKKKLFDRALKKLGHLEADEIYGFKQPLFAGGRLILDNLEIVKLDQNLTLARQLGGEPKIPFANVESDF
jgi:hypothetical protein